MWPGNFIQRPEAIVPKDALPFKRAGVTNHKRALSGSQGLWRTGFGLRRLIDSKGNIRLQI
jgi:hypothetical protein